MGRIRIVAILVGLAVVFPLEYWIGVHSYISLPLGVLGYLITCYIGWAIIKRRRLKLEMNELVEEARRRR